jgi:hypothetical protein
MKLLLTAILLFLLFGWIGYLLGVIALVVVAVWLAQNIGIVLLIIAGVLYWTFCRRMILGKKA